MLYAPIKQNAHRTRTIIAIIRDTLSLFLMAGCKNQILNGISKRPITMQTNPRTLLTVLIISICKSLYCSPVRCADYSRYISSAARSSLSLKSGCANPMMPNARSREDFPLRLTAPYSVTR